MMKLTVFFVCLSVLGAVAAGSYAQNTKVSLNLKRTTIKSALKEIENTSNYLFLYNNDLVNVDKIVDVNADNQSIESVLNELFRGEAVKYVVMDRQIIISPDTSAPLPAAQESKITGTVRDSGGQTLPGVTVVVKGTTNGTITDMDGKFSIAAKGSDVLVFSFVGMQTVEFAANKTVIDVTMQDETIGLEEVVAIGYGVVKKSDVTGSVARVSAEDIQAMPVQNALQAMQGRVSGVDVTSNSRPGEVAGITIRGTRSINGSNSPLYVVDGIILMGSINDVNPNDIESVEILKDASATAIYGSRGANGVILVTTKKGKEGRLTVNYDGSVSFDGIHSLTDWASSGEAMDRMRLAEINGGTYLLGADALKYPNPQADINKFGNSDDATIAAIRAGYEWEDPGTFSSVKMRAATAEELAKGWPSQVPVYNPGNIPTTDWVDILTQTAVTQNHLLSLSAGTNTSKLYFSFGYYNNEGTQKNQGYDRYTIKVNGDITPVKWLTVGSSINAVMSTQSYGTINRSGSSTGAKDMYGVALSQYLMAKPYDDNGEMILYPGNNKSAPTWNPLIDLEHSSDERRAVNVQANLYSEINFTPWLKYRMNFGSGFRYNRSGTWQGSQSTLRRTASPQTSAASYSTSDNFQYMLENLVFFNKTVGIHAFGATLMQSMQKSRTESSNISASKILYDTSEWYNLGANLNGKPDSYGTGFTENTLESYMGRVNYTLKDRYLLTVTGRFDGASVLSTGNKWDFFPSFAAAWKVHEENFMNPITWLNELKLRFGYGVTGNSSVDPYSTAGPLAQYSYVYGTVPAIGYIPYNMPNPSLGWEKTSQINLGIDYVVLMNRISGSIDLYESNTSDILMDRNIPAVIGYPFITDNIGKMKNRGIEISISTINVKNKNFQWATDLNWSSNKEEIVELVNGKEDMKGNNWFIGQPLSVFRNYKVDGLWQNTAEDLAEIESWKANGYNFQPGQYKPVEQGTPNYKLEDDDKVIVGNPRPKWVAGMTNTFTYKDFELSTFMYARVGQKYFSSLVPGGSGGGNFVGYMRSVDPDDFWSIDNPGGKYPEPTTNTKASNADVNRATYINDGSFVIIRNIALSYNLPKSLLSKYNINNCQVYTQVLNPFIFGGKVVKAGINPDDTNGWTTVNSVGDPTGGSNNNTMIVRSLVLGVKIGF